MNSKYLWFVVLICLFCANCFLAQTGKEDAVEILKKLDEACARIKAIEYEETQFDAEHGEKSPNLVANVKQARANVPEAGYVLGKYLITGKFGKNTTEFAHSYDGKYLRILETSEKVVRVVKSPTPYIAGSMLGNKGIIGFPEFSEDNYYKTFIAKSDKITYEGTKEVDGQLCHIINITYTREHPALGKVIIEYKSLIGAKDFLPRGLEIAGLSRQIKILKINDPATEMDSFAVATPDGFGEKLVTGTEAKTKNLLTIGSDAPELNLTDPAGKTHSLKDYRGKVVLIDFWGTWCVPCRKSMPGIQILHERFKNQNVAVFGISVADEEGNPIEYMKKKEFTYGLLLKGDEVATAYRAQVLPTLYVIGKDGKIVHAEFGHRPNALEDLIKIIEKNL